MGTRAWHVARADYHKEVADFLRSETDYPDWSLVALYYSALHLVDSVLADDPELPKDERNPRKHTGHEMGQRGRNQLVRARCSAIHADYRNLEELSRRTRYDIKKLSEPENAYDQSLGKWQHINEYARMMHLTRPIIPSDAP